MAKIVGLEHAKLVILNVIHNIADEIISRRFVTPISIKLLNFYDFHWSRCI